MVETGGGCTFGLVVRWGGFASSYGGETRIHFLKKLFSLSGSYSLPVHSSTSVSELWEEGI